MMTRRNFLGLGLVGAAMPLIPASSAALGALLGGPAESAHYRAVFDKRFSESVLFGETLAALDVPAAGIVGDITSLWFNDLDPRWRQGAVAVSGLTASGPLFCMEQMMGQYGLRLAFRGEHAYQSDGAIRHRLSGDPAVLASAPGLADSGSGWSRSIAAMVRHSPARPMGPDTVEIVTARAAPKLAAAPTLYSWLLAPVERA